MTTSHALILGGLGLLFLSSSAGVGDAAINRLHPKIRDKARRLVSEARRKGIDLEVVSTLRTYAEQTRLYAQGRTAPGPIVTNARAGHSWHNFGLALDVVPVENGQRNYKTKRWADLAAIGKRLGFEWGGDWTSIVDKPHFQMKFGQTLTQMRAKVDSGQVDGQGYVIF